MSAQLHYTSAKGDGYQGIGHQAFAQFLQYDGEFGKAQAQAAQIFGHHDAQPAQFGHVAKMGGLIARKGVAAFPQALHVDVASHEIGRAFAQHFDFQLCVGERVFLHGRSHKGRSRTFLDRILRCTWLEPP